MDILRVAQRRPGPRPRRHQAVATSWIRLISAQRRPGPRPRRHRDVRVDADPEYQRSTKAGAETPATPASGLAGRDRPIRSTKAGAETPATLLIGAEHLHGRNSVPDLPTPNSDFDHLFGLCLGMDVVTDPQMSSKSATNHNFEPSGA